MASLTTHVTVSAVVAGMAASAYLGAGMVTPTQAFLLWGAGTLGGILPDLDADHSEAVRVIFGATGILAGALTVVLAAGRTSILAMWALFALVYGLIRYPLRRLFARGTRHRGAFHSLTAALFCGAIAVIGMARGPGASGAFSWLFGIAVSAGFTLHLVLDELSSVDLVRVRVKGSFGSALKLMDRDALWVSTLLLALAAMGLALLAPRPASVRDVLFNGRSPAVLKQHFWPRWSLLRLSAAEDPRGLEEV